MVFALIAAILLAYFAARFDLRLGRAHVAYRLHGTNGDASRIVADVGMALLVIALFRLTQMLGKIAAGETFSTGVIRNFRGFALWLLLAALTGLIGPLASDLFRSTAPQHAPMQIALDFRQLLNVAITLLLFLLANILEHARHLEAEMREFV